MIKKAPTKREVASQEKRKRICDISMELFHTYGYDNTTINDICKACDVSTGTIYNFSRIRMAY